MLESAFQKKVIDSIKAELPGAVILKNDPTYLQGIPDLTIFYNKRWAMLEVKNWSRANHRPNQEYWVNKLDTMSFARFIYPENCAEVLHELYKTLRS